MSRIVGRTSHDGGRGGYLGPIPLIPKKLSLVSALIFSVAFLYSATAHQKIAKAQNLFFGPAVPAGPLFGVGNTALGVASGNFMGGIGNTAIGAGVGNFMFGIGNTAIGAGSGNFVLGIGNQAVGMLSGNGVVGIGNQASGLLSGNLVAGIGNQASGILTGNAVVGVNNQSSGLGSGNLVAGLGNQTSGTGTGNVVVGVANQSSGLLSGNGVLGIGNQASGIASGNLVAGIGNQASGIASGNGVVGDNNIAFGTGAGNGVGNSNTISMGTGANAGAQNSTAIGSGATVLASHSNSTALGNGSTTTFNNQVMLGTSTQTYTTPGITSALSKGRQSGPLEVVTSDVNGNLATDGGQLYSFAGTALEGRSENQAGVAIAMAMENPDLVGAETFGVALNFGFFEDSWAIAGAMQGVLGTNVFSTGDRIAVNAGVGVSLGEQGFFGYRVDNAVGGRVGIQATW